MKGNGIKSSLESIIPASLQLTMIVYSHSLPPSLHQPYFISACFPPSLTHSLTCTHLFQISKDTLRVHQALVAKRAAVSEQKASLSAQYEYELKRDFRGGQILQIAVHTTYSNFVATSYFLTLHLSFFLSLHPTL